MIRPTAENVGKYRCLPLWWTHLRDTITYLVKLAPFARRYPLADRKDAPGHEPLFMISAGRSGTTLLRSMLVADRKIAIPPETQVIHLATRKFLSMQHLGWADLSRVIVALFESHRLFHLWETQLHPAYRAAIDLPPERRCLAAVVGGIFQCYADQHFPSAITWGDQSPIHAAFLPWITPTFPTAKYLHVLRDGRDVIASYVERGDALEEATYRWRISVKHAMRLCNRLNEDHFLEIRYENLVSDPVGSLHRVCAFAGIPYAGRMLDFWKAPTTIEHKYHEHHVNLAKPLFTDSVGKWRERLSPAQQEYVLPQVSPLLHYLGYV